MTGRGLGNGLWFVVHAPGNWGDGTALGGVRLLFYLLPAFEHERPPLLCGASIAYSSQHSPQC